MKTKAVLSAVVALALAGCSSTQIKYDAGSLASKIGDTYEDETLENLAHMLYDFNHVPSLIDLKDGTIEADESFNPSVTIPFGNQVTTTVIGTPGQTIQAPSRSFTLGGSVGDKLILGVSPVNDVIRLRNTAAIYRYVLRAENDQTAERVLRASYHFPTKAGPSNTTIIDDAYLRPPQCVLCPNPNGKVKLRTDLSQDASIPTDYANMTINPGLQHGWLHTERLAESDHYLGFYGGHRLWGTSDAYQNGYLPNLVMLLLPASQPPAPPKSGS